VTQMLLKHGIGQLPAISQQIGHRDVSTTERNYAHWITEHRDVLAKRLDEPVAQVVSMWGGRKCRRLGGPNTPGRRHCKWRLQMDCNCSFSGSPFWLEAIENDWSRRSDLNRRPADYD
jgi:hypothetical protein